MKLIMLMMTMMMMMTITMMFCGFHAFHVWYIIAVCAVCVCSYHMSVCAEAQSSKQVTAITWQRCTVCRRRSLRLRSLSPNLSPSPVHRQPSERHHDDDDGDISILLCDSNFKFRILYQCLDDKEDIIIETSSSG